MSTVLDRLRRLDCCAVSDAMDALGLQDRVALGLASLATGARAVGRVVTVTMGPPRATARHLGTAAVEAAGPGDVIVVANGGRLDVACWGGNLALGAVVRGVAGVVLDGATRDADEIRSLGLPVWARGTCPLTARGRLSEHACNEPVVIAGVPVEPGDFAVADGTGVAFVPGRAIEPVVAKAEEIMIWEEGLAARLRAGEPIGAVMGARYERKLQTPSR